MDDYSAKRAAGGLVIPRKGSGLVLRETAESRDTNALYCNRIGCSGRPNHTKSAQSRWSENFKSSQPSFRASSGKEIRGSSARTCSMVTNTRKSLQEPLKKMSTAVETYSSETNSVLNENESAKVRLNEVGSSFIASNSRPQNMSRQKHGVNARDNLIASSVPLPFKSTSQGARNSPNAGRYGLRNLRCNSMSDVLPSGCSRSESNLTKRKEIVKKISPEVESSSSGRGKKISGPLILEDSRGRCKKTSGPLLEDTLVTCKRTSGPLIEVSRGRGKKMNRQLSDDSRSSTSSSGISISDSRRARNLPSSGDNGVRSVRTRRSINSNTSMRVCNQGNRNSLASRELPIVAPQVPEPEITIGLDVPSSSHQFSTEVPSSHSSSDSRSLSTLSGILPLNRSEHGINRALTNRDGLRRRNMDGIEEVMLALERIENDVQTYEQLLALEANLLLGGLGFYDQHRDMRLDIDNMSYEDLLALEEKMGTVSTALTEESLSKCLKRSIYQPTSPDDGTMGCDGDADDTKCSICQEEYAIGDELGRLVCQHGYHVVCIHQWLRQKNWCPICKASAGSSESSSSPLPSH